MKSISLLFVFLATLCIAQNGRKMPVFPGCENQNTPKALLDCFNSYISDFSKTYLIANKNLFHYLQYPSAEGILQFRLNKDGKFSHIENKEESLVYNLIGYDLIEMHNLYLEHQNKQVIPGKDENGESVGINFRLPIKLDQQKHTTLTADNTIRFTVTTDQKYVIKQNSNFDFIVYDANNQEVLRTNSLTQFYHLPILSEIVKNQKNLITEKTVDGNVIRLEIENLFKNQKDGFKITYKENGILVKEYNSMAKFLKSDHSKYIY